MKYFSRKGDPKLDFDNARKSSLNRLDRARGYAGIPFIITSSARGPKQGAHSERPCPAFDIAACTPRQRSRILYGLYKAGFKRVGVNLKNNHIHADDSEKLDQDVFWIE